MNFYDKDLNPVIESASSEDLKPLVEYMLKKFSNEIDLDERYKNNPDDCEAYADLIADEIRRFGGNTFANLARGREGVPYREVVCDVAKKMKVKFDHNSSVEQIEECIITKVFEDAWEKMTDEERENIIKENMPDAAVNGGVQMMKVQMILKMGGFKTYQLAVIVANAVAKQILGRGLAFAANQGLVKAIGIFAGPIGWVISGLWTIVDIAGPSYKTTIPCVIHVAMLRQKQKMAE